MATILDGKKVRNIIRSELQALRANFAVAPKFAIIQVGERPDSTAYISQKIKFAKTVGVEIFFNNYPVEITQEQLSVHIKELNHDTSVHGIIVQLPLPAHLSGVEAINTIDPIKDVDGLTSYNSGLLWQHSGQAYIPATAKGVMRLLKEYSIPVSGKHCVIVGKSQLVGKPIALALMNEGATVTSCDKKTNDLARHTQAADILIVAAGKAGLITKYFVRPGQIVIDVGINNNPDPLQTNMIGDVVYMEVEPIVAAITPVPGGVGPITVASLFANVIEAYQRQIGK